MVTSVKDGADETSLDGRRSYTRDHNRRFTEKSRKGRVEVDFTVAIKGDINNKIDKKIGNGELPGLN
jgi:hypothetical protein